MPDRTPTARTAGVTRATALPPIAAFVVWVLAVGTGEGSLLWLEVPVVLLAAERFRTTGALLALLAPIALALAVPAVEGAPPPLVGLLVVGASAALARRLRERLDAERAALRSLAQVDALTGLGNRRLLADRLAYEIARHGRHGRRFALFVLDLDGFKRVNDRFGHPAGDELLREVARALQRTVRDQDTVIRQGGDEFCVLAPETDSTSAERLAGRLGAAVADAAAGLDRVTASVGYAIFPEDGEEGAALFVHADDAQLTAKRRRRRDEEVAALARTAA